MRKSQHPTVVFVPQGAAGKKFGSHFLIRSPLLGKRLVEQLLRFTSLIARCLPRHLVMRWRDAGIEFEQMEQKCPIPERQVKPETVIVYLNQFHASRSRVACKVYFWS